MHDRDHAKRVRPTVDQLVVDILFDRVISEYLDVGVDLTSTLRRRAPESVLQLEADHTVTVVRVKLRKCECCVQGENSDSPGVNSACAVSPRWVIRHLGEDISGDTTLVAHLPDEGCLVIVHFPNALEQGGDGVLVLLDRGELNAARESEVGDPVGQGLDIVEGDLLVT